MEVGLAALDIFADGELGTWVLDTVDPSSVGFVVTTDRALQDHAKQRHANVLLGDPETARFECQQMALSIHYHRILSAKVLARYNKVYNLHPGYLPWGRGMYPVFWALWGETPAGATLHEITHRIDSGPIVDRIRVDYSSSDTGWTLYQRVREAERTIFLRSWPFLVRGELLPVIERKSIEMPYHSAAAFFQLKRNRHWESLTASDLIRLSRALTFPGYSGLELWIAGRWYEVTVSPCPFDVE